MKTSYKPEHAIEVFFLSTKGVSHNQIAKSLGVSSVTFQAWQKKKALLRYAIKRGQEICKDPTQGSTLKEYVIGHLPKELKALWNSIEFWADHLEGTEKVEALLANTGKKQRQMLWLHAYMANSFNASKANKFCQVSKSILDEWRKDPQFARLVEELKWQQKNYYESALVDLVAKGDAYAITFVNRTINRDRGYGDKIEVEHSGTIQHNHTIDLSKLNLSLSCRKEILLAVKAQESEQKLLDSKESAKDAIIEAETSDTNSTDDEDL